MYISDEKEILKGRDGSIIEDRVLIGNRLQAGDIIDETCFFQIDVNSQTEIWMSVPTARVYSKYSRYLKPFRRSKPRKKYWEK